MLRSCSLNERRARRVIISSSGVNICGSLFTIPISFGCFDDSAEGLLDNRFAPDYRLFSDSRAHLRRYTPLKGDHLRSSDYMKRLLLFFNFCNFTQKRQNVKLELVQVNRKEKRFKKRLRQDYVSERLLNGSKLNL